MEIKHWTYAEFPEFKEPVEGVKLIPTTGDEQDVLYLHDVEYMKVGDVPLRLQILIPATRNHPYDFMHGAEGGTQLPCYVFVQGSGWFQQAVYRTWRGLPAGALSAPSWSTATAASRPSRPR